MTTEEINSIEIFKKRSATEQMKLLQKIRRENNYSSNNFEERIIRLEKLALQEKVVVDEAARQAKEEQEQKLRAERLRLREEKKRLQDARQNYLKSVSEILIKSEITVGHILEVIRDNNNFDNVTLGKKIGMSGCILGSHINHKPVIAVRYYIKYLDKFERYLKINLGELFTWNYSR